MGVEFNSYIDAILLFGAGRFLNAYCTLPLYNILGWQGIKNNCVFGVVWWNYFMFSNNTESIYNKSEIDCNYNNYETV